MPNRDELRALALVLILASLLGVGAALAGPSVPVGNAGHITLSLTPQAVGPNSFGRVELLVKNDGDADQVMICGYFGQTLSLTPGATAGSRYKGGEGWIKNRAPELVYSCISADLVQVSFEEQFVRTATATATATVTPTV